MPLSEKHDQQPLLTEQPRKLYVAAMLCVRYLGNRAASVSRSIRSGGGAASASPQFAFPSRTHNHHTTGGCHSPTAYLSGMRGVAAVIVFIFHAAFAHTGAVQLGYGVDPGPGPGDDEAAAAASPPNRHLLQLPLLRLVHSGCAMVAFFFVVGGYVNAAKPLRLLRAGRHAELVPAQAGALLRRAPRLYLPALITMLATALLTYSGVFEPARTRIAANPGGVFFSVDLHPVRHETLAATLANWRDSAWQLCDPWRQPAGVNLVPPLWTVPLEFRASLIVSLLLAAVACCRGAARVALMAAAALFMARCDRWEVTLFLAGAMLAELDLARADASGGSPTPRLPDVDVDVDEDEAEAQRQPAAAAPPRRSRARALATVLAALAGLYLMSYPPVLGEKTPGFVAVSRWLVPWWTGDAQRWVHGAGATLFLLAASGTEALQRPFLTPAAQYLGKVSFALYLVHGPVLQTVGYSLSLAVMAATGGTDPEATPRAWEAGLALGIAINLALVLGVADLFYRFVDLGCVRLAAAFQKLCTRPGY